MVNKRGLFYVEELFFEPLRGFVPKKDDRYCLFCKVEFANLINKYYLCMVLIA